MWGAAASTVFFPLVHAGLFGRVVIPRYCTGHPVAYLETILFFLGMAALAAQGRRVVHPCAGLRYSPLGDDSWADLPTIRASRCWTGSIGSPTGGRGNTTYVGCDPHWSTWLPVDRLTRLTTS